MPIVAGLIGWFVSKKKTPPPASSSTSRPAAPPASSSSSPLPKAKWATPYKGRHFEPLFTAMTAQYGLPAGLLSRQAQRESAYDPVARSPAGALGIMQIVPKWHPSLDPGDAAADAAAALDPTRAIPYAAKYLRYLFDRFGSWTLALAAYNAGETVVARYGLQNPQDPRSPRIARGGVPPYTETRQYVAAILPDVGIFQPESGVRYA